MYYDAGTSGRSADQGVLPPGCLLIGGAMKKSGGGSALEAGDVHGVGERHAEMIRGSARAAGNVLVLGRAARTGAGIEMTIDFHGNLHRVVLTFGETIGIPSFGICEYIDSRKIVKTIFTNCIFYP